MKSVEALQRLRASGFTEAQAEAIVSAGDQSATSYLATKADVAVVSAALVQAKPDLIMWMVGLVLGTNALSLTLFFILLSRIH